VSKAKIPRFCPSCGGDRGQTDSFCEYCGRAFANGAGPGADHHRDWVEAQRYIVAGDTPSAARCVDAFEASMGLSADTLALRAMIRLRCVQLDEARLLLDQALALDPRSPFVHLKNAEYWIALGVIARARESLLEARTLSVSDDVQWVQVGRLLQAFETKTRWSFARGRNDELSASPLARAESSESNVPHTKGANAWES
jgi:predicted Zn-dependent protease